MPKPPAAAPEHFFAYLFDDIHLQQADLQRVRDAAAGHIARNLGVKDRIAIFTTSGQVMLDFTGDRALLNDTLNRLLVSHPIAASHPCPDIDYYWARLIRDHDHEAWYFGMLETMGCTNMIDERIASGKLEAGINSAINMREQEIRASFNTLKDLVRRTSIMPGQRTIVLVSPGFLSHDAKSEEGEVIDLAIHSKVVINSLDGRLLYTENRDTGRKAFSIPTWPDPAYRSPPRIASEAEFIAYQENTEHQTTKLQEDVLGEVASGTGGSFFHNSNDLAEGFRQLASVPEYSYVLGFSPEDMKFDGAFHALKVVVKNPRLSRHRGPESLQRSQEY